MKSLAAVFMAGMMSMGMMGCDDNSDECSYYGTSGGCYTDIPYSCPNSNECSSSSSCSNLSC